MKQGLYEYVHKEKWNKGHVIVRLKETPKSYCLTLVENTIRYSPAQIDMLFQKSDKVKISKEKSPYAFIIWMNDGFTIYPFRAGIPFGFEYVEE